MAINVYWWESTRMSYSCCHLLNLMLDAYECRHYDRLNPPPADAGCILVFHGGNEQLFSNGTINAGRISAAVADFPWVIFVSIGDEASEFPSNLLTHSNFRLWLQAPRASSIADRYLIQGFPDHTRRPDPMPTRDLDYFFSGQVTHPRREQCHKWLARCWEHNPNGLILATAGFNQGLPFPDYLNFLARCRIAPCPAGPATVDTFRVYEALEMGAVPLLDSRSLRDDTVGVWPKLLGNHPLPVIDDWSDLPSMLPRLIADWGVLSLSTRLWWNSYKRDWEVWLTRDLFRLNANSHSAPTEEVTV